MKLEGKKIRGYIVIKIPFTIIKTALFVALYALFAILIISFIVESKFLQSHDFGKRKDSSAVL